MQILMEVSLIERWHVDMTLAGRLFDWWASNISFQIYIIQSHLTKFGGYFQCRMQADAGVVYNTKQINNMWPVVMVNPSWLAY